MKPRRKERLVRDLSLKPFVKRCISLQVDRDVEGNDRSPVLAALNRH